MFHEVSDVSPSLSLAPGEQSPSLSPIIGLSLCSPVHIVLLGDSTLDNSRHVSVPIEVLLSAECSRMGWQYTFLAQDGASLDDMAANQLPHIPSSATHVILSVSGNDLLRLLNELSSSSFAMGAVYEAVTTRLEDIARRLKETLELVASTGCHLACCTIYTPLFDHVLLTMLVTTSLAIHNRRIRKIARDLGLALIDLACVCTQPSDFVNALELSVSGGNKVVSNLSRFVRDNPPECLPRVAWPEGGRPPVSSSLASWFPQVACCTCAEKTRLYADPEVLELRVEEEQKSRTWVPLHPVARSPSTLDFSQKQEMWRRRKC